MTIDNAVRLKCDINHGASFLARFIKVSQRPNISGHINLKPAIMARRWPC